MDALPMNRLTLKLVIILSSFLLVGAAKIKNHHHPSQKQTYIIHMDKSKMPAAYANHMEWYGASLRSVSGLADMLYSYDSVIHGFSTRLTIEESRGLGQLPGILSVLPEVQYELHTTRSPEFLGLEGVPPSTTDTFPPSLDSGSEVIIGVLDTGVWPESMSFNDSGLGPAPARWKGECEEGKTFTSKNCNRKLIGARYFSKGYEAAMGPIDESIESKSPRDDDGHGTHTSTTAAGSTISGASLFGFASGTARGMAPHARVAAYKVCWLGGCFSSDVLAAIDRAINDGVDVISLSIGGGIEDYYRHVISIGAFSAMSQGIFVSCSAGNGGPSSGSVANVAPWTTAVGAGTLDRSFPAYVTLGNGKKYIGMSLYSGKPISGSLPLIYAGKASSSLGGDLCMTGSLDPSKAAGKIVICDRGGNSRAQKGVVVRDAGGLGMILANTEYYGEELVADPHVLPSAALGQKAGDEVKKYASSVRNPTAAIASGGTQLGIQPSPVVAAFSSRGPNPLDPRVLKPDIIAPGVNILAGWTGAVGPTGLSSDKRRVGFNIISGTSMSCPHVSGLAVLLKGAHPSWSPGAIRSALMTTSYTTYKNGSTMEDMSTGSPSTPFDYGAGHVDPMAASDPGLVYNTTVHDYLGFLCALNYSQDQIKRTTNMDFACGSDKSHRVEDLNYPSFAVPFDTASEGAGRSTNIVKYTRTVTNVGNPGTYVVSISSESRAVKISVEPGVLSFSAVNEKKSYTVTFVARSMPSGTTSFARLEWSDGKHKVKSPIAFTWT